MLTELKLTNFRIFDDEVTVRFRPITVLIGRNNSGKSSIIKFLLMLQQSIASGRSQFLTTDGDLVHLGTFSELKNSLSRKRNMRLVLTVSAPQPDFPIFSMLQPQRQDVNPYELLYRADATVSYGSIGAQGRASWSFVHGPTGRDVRRFDTPILNDTTFLNRPILTDNLSELLRQMRTSLATADVDALAARIEGLDREEMAASLMNYAAETDLLGTLRHQLNSIRHLPPARHESERVIVASSPPIDYVGPDGQYTLPHLQQIVNNGRERYEFMLPYLANIAGLKSVEFKTSAGYVSQAFATNATTGADVLIADYGFGVSQCLPILVQGAIMPPHTSLMIEQPEAQLHPTAQLELGSFFADLWTKRKVGSIVEIHSANILLRIRRLIATSELSHEDVSVAFFTFDEDNGNMPIVKNLDIAEDGSMQPGLPMEFFGADIVEGLRLGARE